MLTAALTVSATGPVISAIIVTASADFTGVQSDLVVILNAVVFLFNQFFHGISSLIFLCTFLSVGYIFKL